MSTYFECKIRYDKTQENGLTKKVTEPYLVNALSFTEAEARIIEETTPFITGEFLVADIRRANYNEVVATDDEAADRWFRCKVNIIVIDEKSGAEKKTPMYLLMQAADINDARTRLINHMKGTMADYTISSLSETAIMDIYEYDSK